MVPLIIGPLIETFFYFSCFRWSATLWVTLGNNKAAKASLLLRAVPSVSLRMERLMSLTLSSFSPVARLLSIFFDDWGKSSTTSL